MITQESSNPHDPRLNAPRVDIRRVAVRYPAFSLGPLSLRIDAGERVALLGPNGSGKTTLLRALAGQLGQYEGSIMFAGNELRTRLPEVRQHLGVLPETLGAYGWMTCSEHLGFLRNFYPSWDTEYAIELAESLSLALTQRIDALSRGARVKLSFVAAEAFRPRLLLLDEPTTGLDPQSRGELLSAVVRASHLTPGRTVIFSTHILEDVERLADRVLQLRNGTLVDDASLGDYGNRYPGVSLAAALYRSTTTSQGASHAAAVAP
jgi:ABC-2 type transport system ATP-binding protein